MVILGTGNYDNIKNGNTVSVTGDGGNAWGYYGPAYKKLAPKLATYLPYADKYKALRNVTNSEKYMILKKQIEDEYIKSYYETRLKDLDVEELLSILYDTFGSDLILLCHEKVNEFCHRRLIADYIELKTGIYIPEIKIEEKKKIKELKPIRYTDRLKKLM